jgi:hypothetical protein
MYQPGGSVWVGTQTPGSKLDVAGDINFSGTLNYQHQPFLWSPGANGLTGNTAVGYFVLSSNTAGLQNTGVGTGALSQSTSGYSNTAVGVNALASNITGLDNTAIGVSALGNGTGNSNIGIGVAAGVLAVTGSNNIHIGSQGVSTDNGTIRIGSPGNQNSFFAVGISGAAVNGVPVLVDTTTGQLGVASSSRRFKEDIQDMADASNGLMRLRPVTFRYQKPLAEGSKPIQYGLIAEEVEEVYPDLVAKGADGQIETVKYQLLDTMLLNEVQKQQKKIDELEKENDLLRDRLARLEAAMERIAHAPVGQ